MDQPQLVRSTTSPTCLKFIDEEEGDIEEGNGGLFHSDPVEDEESSPVTERGGLRPTTDLRSESPDTVEVTDGEKLILEQVQSLFDLLSELLELKLKHSDAMEPKSSRTISLMADGVRTFKVNGEPPHHVS